MKTFNRTVANAVKCPTELSALKSIIDEDLKFHDDYLSHMLTKLMTERALSAGHIGKENIKTFGQKLFGKANYERVCENGELPCLRALIKMAAALGQSVVYRNYRYDKCGCEKREDFRFGETFDKKVFVELLKDLGARRNPKYDSQEMIEERTKILEQLNAARPKFDWKLLIRYSLACGYQLNCYLVAKEKRDGCLTPNKKTAMTVNENREEYEALLRRLNYPD